MFHSTITFLMTAFMAAHALLGCCWHHAHACSHPHTCSDEITERLTAVNLPEADVEHNHAGHHHHAGHCEHEPQQRLNHSCPEHERNHHNPPCGECDEETCTYVASSSIKIHDDSKSLSYVVPPCHDAQATACTSVAFLSVTHPLGYSASGHSAAVRAQLISQVWLL